MKKQKTSSPNILQILFILTVSALPFVFTLKSADPALPIRFLTIAVMLFLVLAATTVQLIRNKSAVDYSFLRRMIFPIFLIYVLIGAISLLQAINLAEGITDLSKAVLFLIFFIVATGMMISNPRFIAHLSRGLVISAAILAIIGICQYFRIAFMDISSNTYLDATFFNKNLFANALLLMLPFIVYGILNFKGIWSDLSIFSLLISGFIIGASHTRASWVGFAGMIILFLLSKFLLKKQTASPKQPALNWKRMNYAGIILIIVVLLSAGAEYYYRAELFREIKEKKIIWKDLSKTNKLASRNYTPWRSVNIRFIMWKKTLQMIADRPLTGVGLGNWKIQVPKYGTVVRESSEGKQNFIRPHNDYLWVFAEMGIFGFLGYLALFAMAFYYIYRIIFHSNDPEAKLLAILMACGITSYLLFSNFDFPRERIVHSTFLLLLIAAVTASYHKLFPYEPRMKQPSILPINIIMLFLTLACIGLGYSRLNSDIHTQRAELLARQQNRPLQIQELNQAETFFYNMDPVANPLTLHRGEAHVALNQMDLAYQDFLEAARVHPYNILALWNLGAMYDRRGELDKSEAVFKKILDFSPYIDGVLLNLTAVYIKMKKYDEAYEVIQRCDPKTSNTEIIKYREYLKQKVAEK